MVEFSGQVAFTYVMAGMSSGIDPAKKLSSTLDAAAESGMPADARLWLECPPSSSYPSCLAVKAAAEQQLDVPYLRRLREGAFLRRERLDDAPALTAAGRDVEGLDPARLESDLRSGAVAERFAADRVRARAACGAGRPALPAFAVDGGDPLGIAELRDAVLAAGAEPGPLPPVAEVAARFGAVAPAEVAAICGISGTRAKAELWRLAGESAVRPVELPFGELFEPT